MRKKDRKSPIRVPLILFLAAVALLALSFIASAVLLKELHNAEVRLHEAQYSEYLVTASDLLIEFFKAIFLGVCIGFGVEYYLKHLEIVHSQREKLEKSGIEDIYPSRGDALDRFKELAEDYRVKTINIMGISLREFLTGWGSMYPVWKIIRHRLEHEEKQNVAADQRLRVRLLMLDPRSSEGHFRYKVEDPLSIDETVDVQNSLNEIRQTLTIYREPNQEFFQARLYEHCPFSFIFLTEKRVFGEQYYYKDYYKYNDKVSNTEALLPLIEYSRESLQHEILRDSLEAIWTNANEKRIGIGTAIPIEEARIRNIYRADKREEQGKNQIECIKNNEAETIDILNITGGFYVNEGRVSDALLAKAAGGQGTSGQTVRLALLNPVCQQAIFRAVAERPTEEMGQVLYTYNWHVHRTSKLYTRVRENIHEVMEDWINRGYSVELRLYSCSTVCALLLTSQSAFVGQYIYGRSRKLQKENRLQSEYPLIEYDNTRLKAGDNTEQEILESTFKIIWDHYSISYEAYKSRNEEAEFNKNLNRLREELGRKEAPQGQSTMKAS